MNRRRLIRDTARAFALLIVTLLVGSRALPALQAASTPASEPGEWLAIYDFALEVDGKAVPEARFYGERDSTRLLIEAPGLAKVAILKRDATKEVTAIDVARVRIDEPTDTARVSPGAEKGAPTSTYTVDGVKGEVILFVGDQRVKILPKLPLLGPATREQILLHTPQYKKAIHEYTPDPKELSFLRSCKEQVNIEVYFGTWCPHCKEVVPKFMKSIEMAANPNLKVSYTGLPKNFGESELARARSVTQIPTFIFSTNGKEFGRLPRPEADNAASVEQAVCDVLRMAHK